MKNKDKNLQKAIDNLPTHTPNDDLWGKIEAGLNEQKNLNLLAMQPKKKESFFAILTSQKYRKAQWAMAASTFLGIVSLSIWQQNQAKNSSDIALKADIQKVSNIKPAFQSIDVEFKHLVVDTEKGAVVKLPNGTKITVPKNAFVDQHNQPIVGSVDLAYREFQNAAQILASGIPMTYDSAGVTHQFESAGMFEIRGFQDDKPVFIAKDKGIDVAMASFVKGNDFRFYYFDQTDKHNKVAYNVPFFTSAYAQTAQNQANEKTDLAAATGTQSGYWKYVGIKNAQKNEDRAAKIDSAVGVFGKNYQTKIEAEKQAIVQEQEKQEQEKNKVADLATTKTKNARQINRKNFFRLQFDTVTNPETKSFASLLWEYAGIQDENHHPRSAKNYWVMDRKWRELELCQILFKPTALLGHPGEVNDAKFSPNGKFIATAAGGGAKLWDKEGKFLYNLDGHPDIVKQVDFSSDSKYLLTVAGGLINLWSVEGKLLQSYGYNPNIVSRAVFSADNTKIVGFIGDFTKIWDFQGNLVANIESGDKQNVDNFVSLQKEQGKTAQNNTPYQIRWEGNQMIITKDGAFVKKFKGHQNTILQANFSDDGNFLVTTSKDKTIKVWSVSENFKLLSSLKQNNVANKVLFAPDNQTFLSVAKSWKAKNLFTRDNVVYIWKRIPEVDANIWELNLYCKPKNSEETKAFGDNIAFSTTIYQETEQENVFEKSKPNDKNNPALVKRLQKLNDLIANYEQAITLKREAEERRLAAEAVLLRGYSVTSFGIHNWDRPEDIANSVAIAATFEVDSSIIFNEHNAMAVYLITGESSMIVQKMNFRSKNFMRFFRNTTNQFVVVLPNNQVAIYSAKEFRTLVLGTENTPQQKVYNFVFNNPKPLNSVDDLQAYLKDSAKDL
jgi:hypothetical protein